MIAETQSLRITLQTMQKHDASSKRTMKMTNSELSKFRNVLRTSVIEITSLRRDDILIETSADELDRIHGANERELAVRTLEVVASRRRDAKAALQRIDEGTFGLCIECEKPIGAKRLAAIPSAALCLRCQEAADSRCAAKQARTVFAIAA